MEDHSDSHKEIEITPTKSTSTRWTTLERPRQNVRPVPIVLVPRKHKHTARRRCNTLSGCTPEQRSGIQTEPTDMPISNSDLDSISQISDESLTRQVVYFRGMQAQHRMMSEL